MIRNSDDALLEDADRPRGDDVRVFIELTTYRPATLRSLLGELRFAVRTIRHASVCAVLTDLPSAWLLAGLLSHVLPFPVRAFGLRDEPAAIAWMDSLSKTEPTCLDCQAPPRSSRLSASLPVRDRIGS